MEPADKARFMRHAKALSLKADDPEGLADMLEIVAEFQRQAQLAANRLHDEWHFSWTELARPVGISRQAMRKRFAAPGLA